jgi:peptidyl-prolyl cis-trans isomerase C
MTIRVNGIEVAPEAIERQLSGLPGGPGARTAAERAAATRELLLQRARSLGLADGCDGEAEDAGCGGEGEAGGCGCAGRGNTARDPASAEAARSRRREHAREAREQAAIEALLDREVKTPTPDEAECRRYYEANPARFTVGELVFARHILFAVTPGAPIEAIRRTAEACLREVQSHPERFESLAKESSNCPSGQHGGNLGQLSRGETVPEFERELFSGTDSGVLPRLVKTRYGFHVVAVDRRIEGRAVPFDEARERIAHYLTERVQVQALAQYVRVLAGEAQISGVDLGAATSPLVQ